MSDFKTNSNDTDNAGARAGLQGGAPVYRSVTAGGHPEDRSQPGFPIEHRKLATPLPLGLFSFATTTFCLSLYNLNARGVEIPNGIVALALIYGGMTQYIAGIFEFVCGNTFGCVAFMTFGSFWLSYCVLLIPWFGIVGAFADATTGGLLPEFNQAVSIYLWSWFVVVFIIILASFKSSVAIVATLVLVELVILLLAVANMTGSANCTTAGGAVGIVTAAAAFYTGAASFLTPELSYFQLPIGNLARP